MSVIRSWPLLMCLWSTVTPAHAGENAANWPSYFGNHSAWSYSNLSQIDRGNVGRLLPAWSISWPWKHQGTAGPLITPLYRSPARSCAI
jgi:hypothetical protein